MNQELTAYEHPVPEDQQQRELERQYRRQEDARREAELAALEKRLQAQGYDLDELEKDNPYNQYRMEPEGDLR